MINEKTRDFLTRNLGYFAVAFISVVYVLTGFFHIDETGKSVTQIIGDGALSFFLGLFINSILDIQGILTGEREECVRAAIEAHGEMVERISPYIDKLDDWCAVENERNYVRQRTKILARVGLRYEECFDSDGVARPFNKSIRRNIWSGITLLVRGDVAQRAEYVNERKRLRAYRRAVALHLTPLTAGELTGEGARHQDPYYFGRTKAQYEAQRGFGDVISKLGLSIIFGIYGVTLIADFNAANLIWQLLQIAAFIVTGVIKMYQSRAFIVGEFRSRVIKKTDQLQKFANYVRNLRNDEKC